MMEPQFRSVHNDDLMSSSATVRLSSGVTESSVTYDEYGNSATDWQRYITPWPTAAVDPFEDDCFLTGNLHTICKTTPNLSPPDSLAINGSGAPLWNGLGSADARWRPSCAVDQARIPLPRMEDTVKWTTQKRRCSHSIIERRYRSNINDRIAELKDLVANGDAKLSKSAVLKAAVDELKELRRKNEYLRAENKHLQLMLANSRASSTPTPTDPPESLQATAESPSEMDADPKTAATYPNRLTLLALMTCVILTNPIQLIFPSSGSLLKYTPLRGYNFSRTLSAIIGMQNSCHRIILLLVVNIAVISLVWIKLRTAAAKQPWAQCCQLRDSALELLKQGRLDEAAVCLSDCVNTIESCGHFASYIRLIRSILPFKHHLSTVDIRWSTFAVTVCHDLLKISIRQNRHHTAQCRRPVLIALKYMIAIRDQLPQLMQGQIFLMAALQAKHMHFCGKWLMKIFLQKAFTAFQQSKHEHLAQWLNSPHAIDFIAQLPTENSMDTDPTAYGEDDFVIVQMKNDFYRSITIKVLKAFLTGERTPETDACLLLMRQGRMNMNNHFQWTTYIILLANEYANGNTPIHQIDQVKPESSAGSICLLALKIKIEARREDAVKRTDELLHCCSLCSKELASMRADTDLVGLLVCLGIQWCVQALVFTIDAHLKAGSQPCYMASIDLLKQILVDLIHLERIYAEQFECLEPKLAWHVTLIQLLDFNNPKNVKHALMDAQKRSGRPLPATELTSLLKAGPEEWLKVIVQRITTDFQS